MNPELDEAIAVEGLLERVCDGLKGDIVRADISASGLLPLYLEDRDPLRGDDPARDLEALHPRYFLRSAVCRHKDQGDFAPNGGATSMAAPRFSALASPAKRGVKRPLARDASTPAAKREKRWLDEEGVLRCPNGYWSYRTPTTQPNPPRAPSRLPLRVSLQSSDFLGASSFSLSTDASFATTGWEGVPPPDRPRKEIQALYASQPRARALYPWLRHFFPAEYKAKPSVRDERATFFVDRDGLIFMYRSYRASWLMTPEARREFEYAHDLLVGKCAQSSSLQKKWSGAQRGEHLAIILGHYRQSSK
ncbi:hypothetical protein B0H10DRAFT_2437413, partial [Mycena sp. CBHHK59/15]